MRWPGWDASTGNPQVRLTSRDDAHGLGLVRVRLMEPQTLKTRAETAILLLGGTVRWSAGDRTAEASRRSLFDERPSALHVGVGTEVRLEPLEGPVEVAVVEVDNPERFPPAIHRPADVRAEQRGEGMLGGTAHREVRTIVDDAVGPPEARLVLGEVVTFPGRWSSYPPHHHDQPEIYHYRFTRPEGFGYGELSDEVYKLRDGDTLIIPPGRTHAQVAAPGYGMWYLWAIRHLEEARYDRPTFRPEHAWTMAPGARAWTPSRG